MSKKCEIQLSKVTQKINPKFLSRNRMNIPDTSIFGNLGNVCSDPRLLKCLKNEAIFRISRKSESEIFDYVETYCSISPLTVEVFLMAVNRMDFDTAFKNEYLMLVKEFAVETISHFSTPLGEIRYGNAIARIELLIAQKQELVKTNKARTRQAKYIRTEIGKPHSKPIGYKPYTQLKIA